MGDLAERCWTPTNTPPQRLKFELIGALPRLRVTASTRGKRRRFDHAFDVEQREDLVMMGSEYGGYVVPVRLVSSASVCYSCGIGEDATFDLDLITATGCTVYAFDPTPRAIAYSEGVALRESRFVFRSYGVWSSDCAKRFYGPERDEHVSHSIGNLQSTTQYFDADCRTLASLTAELGHERIDILKLDVEGAEYEVLTSVVDGEVEVGIICAEFHVARSVRDSIVFAKRVLDAGYSVVLREICARRSSSSGYFEPTPISAHAERSLAKICQIRVRSRPDPHWQQSTWKIRSSLNLIRYTPMARIGHIGWTFGRSTRYAWSMSSCARPALSGRGGRRSRRLAVAPARS